MSFSGKIKTELCGARLDGNRAKDAVLGGLVFTIGSTHGDMINIATESSDVMKLALKLVKAESIKEVNLNGELNSPFSKKKIYRMSFENSAHFREAVATHSEGEFRFDDSLGYFLRGVFLGAGSVTNPRKAYHLELVFKDAGKAELIQLLLRQRHSLNAKLIDRKNAKMCYIKGAEDISDFLTIVGSVSGVLEFENTRVFKQVINEINRAINCDTANIDKSIDASLAQVEAIKYLIERGLMKGLGAKYEQIAELRLANQELSLHDLGQLAEPKLTKSGCNHRLKRIISEAERHGYTGGRSK